MPPNQILLNSEPQSFRLVGHAAPQADARIVPVQGPGFDRAWRVEVRRQPLAEFQVELVSAALGKLHPGDSVLLSVWARALGSSAADHQGCIGLVLEQSADPYDKALARRFNLGSVWQRLDVAAKIGQGFGRVAAHVAVRLGYFPQTVEIGRVELRRFDSSVSLASLPQTPLTYPGRQSDAAWRLQADRRIESLREAPLSVRVTDAAGRPVSGAAVRVRMLRHAFAFGCAYGDDRFPAGAAISADDLAYQQHFIELFNTGVDERAMKWPDWQDRTTRRAAMCALQWMRDHDIEVRGHCLLWPGWPHLPVGLRPGERPSSA